MKKKSSVGIGKPTKREAEILQFAREYRQENGFSPSLVEIAKHFKRSVPTIHQHVYSLRSKNLLLIDKGKKRSINALHNHKVSEVMIPLMGIISAGGPIEAIRDPKPIDVPRSMLQPTVDDGEKAVAYMPDRNEVTLKKIYREKDRIKLVPANQTMKPFYESNVVIQGKVVGVLRKEF